VVAQPSGRTLRTARQVASAGEVSRLGSPEGQHICRRPAGKRQVFVYRAIGARARGQRPVEAPARAGVRAGARAIGCLLGLLEGGPVSVAWLFIESINGQHICSRGVGRFACRGWGVEGWGGVETGRFGRFGGLR
jgi:hypothetical protein